MESDEGIPTSTTTPTTITTRDTPIRPSTRKSNYGRREGERKHEHFGQTLGRREALSAEIKQHKKRDEEGDTHHATWGHKPKEDQTKTGEWRSKHFG